jgi:hypothetical protein
MDVRRELNHLNKEFRRHHNVANEFVVWYEFERLSTNVNTNSVYDDVYDEGIRGAGGRKYKAGVVVPILLSSEAEDSRRSIPDARQPVQTIEFKASIKDFRRAGITEVWEYQNHLNDTFLYDGRIYGVSDYRVRGRLKDEVLVIIQGFEIYVDQEFVNDEPPSIGTVIYPWPTILPIIG